MSFFDDASLVFLPSGEAGKDGKAYSIKPVPEYGNELVTNGGFDTDSDWTKGTGWTISGGTANCDGTQTTNTLLYQNLGDLSNKTIRLTFTISGYSAGQLSTAFFGAAGTQVENVSANGTYTFDIDVQSGHNGNTGFTANSSFIGSVDNVSVKEVIVDGDFTFSRGSNLTSTRVDSNGLIEKGRENLLLQSNSFDTTWVTTNASVTSGQSGYDGSSDAWLLTASSTSNARVQQNKSFSGVHTFSIYAKSGTNDFLYLRSNGALTYEAYFNLSNGTKSNSSNLITDKITSVGDGWYRCSITFNASSSTDVRAYIVDGFGTINVTNNSTIYIQDAQLEQGLVATEYIESGATTGLAGILEDSPRFDYSGGASCPSLLLEGSRTNLVEYSEYFDSWFNNGGTLTANAATSPEGFENAYSYSNNEYTILRKLLTLSTSTQYTFSFYAKNVDATDAKYRVYDDTNATDVISATSYFSQLSTNEWKRIEVTFTTSATGTAYGVYLASGKQSGKVLFYGAQLEQGSYPTSYIPNHSGGSVTRNADSFEKTGLSSVIGQAEGTIFFEIPISNFDGDQRMAISDGTSSNRIALRIASGGIIQLSVVIGGATQASISASGSINNTYKIALIYKRDYFKIFINGTLEGTDTSGTLSGTFNRLATDRGDGSQNFYNSLNQLLLFPSALSDAECITLTS